MATTKFYIDKRTQKDKKAITMRVNHAGKSFNKGTGISIFPWDWDDKIGYPKDKTSEEFAELATMESLLIGSYNSIKKSLRDVPSMDALKMTFEANLARGGTVNEKFYTVTGAINSFIQQKESFYSVSAIKHYKKLEELVYERFGKTFEDGFDNINKTWATKFIDFLCYEQGYQNSTVEMYLKKLNSVLNFFDKPSLKLSDVMAGMKKSKNVNGDKPYLTLKQVDEFQDYVIVNHSNMSIQYNVIQLFVWCCYTGMRFNEAINVTCSMVKDGVLTYTTTKNGKRITVPLNDWCMCFVNSTMRGKLFEDISNSKCNSVLTDLLVEYGMTNTVPIIRYSGKDMAVIDKPLSKLITFHSSRRSYISNLLDNGIPIKDVALVTGISPSTLINYYASSNQDEVNKKVLEILNR